MNSTRRKYLLVSLVAVLLISGLFSVADARERILLRNTFVLAAAVLGISLPLGTIIGVAATRTDLPGRRGLAIWLAVSLLTPLHLLAAAWQMGLGPQGWVAYLDQSWTTAWFDGWTAAITVHCAAAIPWVAWIVASAARRCERAVEETALLEAPPVNVIRRVLLPQLRPAIAIAAILVASQVTTEIAVTDFFRIRTWAEEVYVSIAVGGWDAIQGTQPLGMTARTAEVEVISTNWLSPTQLTLAGMLLVSWGALLLIALRSLRGARLSPVHESLRYSWGRWRVLAGTIWIAFLSLMLIFPLGNLLLKAGWVVTRVGKDYERTWSLVKVLQATFGSFSRYHNELVVSICSATLAASLGLLIIVTLQWLLRKQSWWLNPGLWLTLIMLLMPGPVVGLLLISVFNNPALPALHPLYDRTLAVVVAAQFLRIWPWMWGVVAVTFSTIGQGQLEQAELEGARPLFVFRKILWPQLWPSWLLAWLLGFELALGELAATILVYPPGRTPLSVQLFSLLHYGYEAEVAGLCLLLILLHAAGVVGIAWLLTRNRTKFSAAKSS